TDSTPDEITFSGLRGAIILRQGELHITDPNLVITGSGSSTIAVSGGNHSRVFSIVAGANVTLSGLTITQGLTVGDGTNDGSNQGGGIFNQGNLTLQNDTLSGNQALGQAGSNGTSTIPSGANGGDALGGGVYSAGNLTLLNDILSGNAAVGGAGGRAVSG